MMRQPRFGIVLLSMVIVGASLLHAQKPIPKTGPVVPAPDLSKLSIGNVMEQMQTSPVQANTETPPPIQVVVQFLQLRPDQAQELGQLLEARQTAVAPLLEGIQQRVQELEALLNSGGSPLDVGILVIQIHALQQQVAQTQQAFLSNLANLLDLQQQQRLEAVRVAAQLQPILPAFQQLNLF